MSEPADLLRVERAVPDDYRTTLKDKYRPPSKGGNTAAWHQHGLTINGERFAFLALGAAKWAYAGEAVSFDWRWDPSGTYRNIDPESFAVWNKAGQPVVRGNRGTKPWRTADTRPPGRRSEWKD